MPLHGQHDLTLVLLSYVVAVIGSFAALTLAELIARSTRVAKAAWLVGGATTMGLGIWGMHFVGMLSFRLPIAVEYDFGIVGLSIVPAVLASGLALWLVSGSTLGAGTYAWGSVFMGGAIAGMHYVGMEAMVVDASLSYRPAWVAGSIAIAVMASFAALSLAFRLREDGTPRLQAKRLLAAAVMGAAIAGMHYTGMAAAVFEVASAPPEGAPLFAAPGDLVLGVAGGVTFVVVLALALAFLERWAAQPSFFQLGTLMIVIPLVVGGATMTLLYREVGDQERRVAVEQLERHNAALAGLVRMHAEAAPVTGLTLDFRESLAGALSDALATMSDVGAGTFEIATFSGDSIQYLLDADREAVSEASPIPRAVELALAGRGWLARHPKSGRIGDAGRRRGSAGARARRGFVDADARPGRALRASRAVERDRGHAAGPRRTGTLHPCGESARRARGGGSLPGRVARVCAGIVARRGSAAGDRACQLDVRGNVRDLRKDDRGTPSGPDGRQRGAALALRRDGAGSARDRAGSSGVRISHR